MRLIALAAVAMLASPAFAEQITVPFSYGSQANVVSKWAGTWILSDPAQNVPTIPGHLDQIKINAKLTYTIGMESHEGMQFFKPLVYSEIVFQLYEPFVVPVWFGSGEAITEYQGFTLPPNTSITFPPATLDYQITLQDVNLDLFKLYGQWAPIIATTSQGMTSFDGTVTGSITYFYTIPEPSTWTLLIVGAVVAGVIYRRKN